MIGRYNLYGSSNVIVSGHPRADLYPEIEDAVIPTEILNKISKRKVVLWNPHFSVSDNKWSTFLEYHEYILDYFEKRTDLFLLVRPHWGLEASLLQLDDWDINKINNYRQRIANMSNALLHEGKSYQEAFVVSDIILSDTSSFLLEYMMTKKPVIYLHKNDGIGLNDDDDVTEHFYVAYNQYDIEQFLDDFSQGKDFKAPTRIKAIDEYMTRCHGGNGKFIADYIVDQVKSNDQPYLYDWQPVKEDVGSVNFWKAAKNSELAGAEYYHLQEKLLNEILLQINNISSIKKALDIGCSNGRYTEIIAKYAEAVQAIDISEPLISQAKVKYLQKNIDFQVGNFITHESYSNFDLVACMGVTSTILDDYKFLELIEYLKVACRKNGYLIMKESLSLQNEKRHYDQVSKYRAAYRNVNEYLKLFTIRGFELIETKNLMHDEESGMTNNLYLFKRS